MKNIFNILFLFLGFQNYAQNVVAGEYDANEYYYDFVPDHVLHAPDPINSSTDSIYIDLNNDGIDDVVIDVHNLDGGNWQNKKHAEIIPMMESRQLRSFSRNNGYLFRKLPTT